MARLATNELEIAICRVFSLVSDILPVSRSISLSPTHSFNVHVLPTVYKCIHVTALTTHNI